MSKLSWNALPQTPSMRLLPCKTWLKVRRECLYRRRKRGPNLTDSSITTQRTELKYPELAIVHLDLEERAAQSTEYQESEEAGSESRIISHVDTMPVPCRRQDCEWHALHHICSRSASIWLHYPYFYHSMDTKFCLGQIHTHHSILAILVRYPPSILQEKRGFYVAFWLVEQYYSITFRLCNDISKNVSFFIIIFWFFLSYWLDWNSSLLFRLESWVFSNHYRVRKNRSIYVDLRNDFSFCLCRWDVYAILLNISFVSLQR